jgi:hypothetical protein
LGQPRWPRAGAPGLASDEIGQALPGHEIAYLLSVQIVEHTSIARMQNHDGLLTSRRRIRMTFTLRRRASTLFRSESPQHEHHPRIDPRLRR